jgi:PEGA domain
VRRHGRNLMLRRRRAARPTSVALFAVALQTLLFAFLALAAATPSARATDAPGREKIAVLVVGASERDAELADNLTEVIIGAIAQRGGVEMAGREEFRARLGVESEQRSQACIDDLACLGRAAVSLGVRRIVAGTLGVRGKQFLFNLNLNNVETNRVENHIFRLVEGGVQDLIPAVKAATDELFRPRVEPGRIQLTSEPAGARVSIDNAYLGVTPLISGTLLAGKHKVRVEADGRFPWLSDVDVFAGQDLGVNLTDSNLPRRRSWPTSAAITSASLGGFSLAAGGFLGVLSQLSPSGASRADAQDDFRQKQHLATAANVAFVSGAVFSLAALYFVLRYSDDIFGRADEAPPR